jgi:hypothetical protein
VAYAGQNPVPKPFLMILNWIKTPHGWRMATDIALPIPSGTAALNATRKGPTMHPLRKLRETAPPPTAAQFAAILAENDRSTGLGDVAGEANHLHSPDQSGVKIPRRLTPGIRGPRLTCPRPERRLQTKPLGSA